MSSEEEKLSPTGKREARSQLFSTLIEKGKQVERSAKSSSCPRAGPRGRRPVSAGSLSALSQRRTRVEHGSFRRRRQASSGGELVGGLGRSGLLLGVGLVELHEFGEVELGLLEDLDLLDEHVLKREDLGALLGDLLGDGVGEPANIYYLLTRRAKREQTRTEPTNS